MSTPGTALDSDLFEDHLSRELTEDDVAELAGDRPRPQAVSWEGDWADTWKPDATIREQRGASSSSSPLMLPRLRDYGVKERCITRWREAVGEQLRKETDFVSREQQAVFAALAGYRDLVYPLYKYPERAGQCGASAGCSAEDPVLDAVLLHVVNHVAKSADRVRKNNADADAAREEGRPIEEVRATYHFFRGAQRCGILYMSAFPYILVVKATIAT